MRAVVRGAGWHLILLSAMLAFAWQSFVSQTHVHFAASTYSTVARGDLGPDSPPAPSRTPQKKSPADCPLCNEIAHAGSYLPPTPVVLNAPEPAIVWRAAATRPRETPTQRSHAWQSRGPPNHLQA